MKSKEELGKALKERRLSLNLSMEFVAKKANITRSTLWSIESGKGNCSIDTLFSLTDILSLDLNLMGKTDNFSKRKRASKTYTSKTKDINRFLVDCVEYYASFSNKSGEAAYIEMKNKGVLDLLKGDYEDMHGMSFEYLCEFIDRMLKN